MKYFVKRGKEIILTEREIFMTYNVADSGIDGQNGPGKIYYMET